MSPAGSIYIYIYMICVYSIHITTHRYDRYVSSFHDSRVLSYFHKLDGWLCIPDEVFQHAVRVDPKIMAEMPSFC